MVIRSVYYEQDQILESIKQLYCPNGYECDITYGNGKFWKNIPPPPLKYDIDPLLVDVQRSCSTNLPLEADSLNNVVFDPPFLTYIKKGREHGSIMAGRFGGYWSYSELENHYKGTLREMSRVLKKKGIMVFKCQDIIHNHSMHCTHINVVNWAAEFGIRLKDLFILPAKSRLPMPEKEGERRRIQRHARIFHSYFLVMEKN